MAVFPFPLFFFGLLPDRWFKQHRHMYQTTNYSKHSAL